MASLLRVLLFLAAVLALASAFAPKFSNTANILRSPSRLAGTITKGVDFNTIAREWRLKWSPDDDKKSLASVQQTLSLFAASMKAVPGCKSVQRIVCGGCLDYKVIVALDADKFAAWEAAKFAPEEEFLRSLKAINGVSQIETQTYTIENV